MVTHTSPVGPRIAVTYRHIADLKPDPKNPRQHSKKQVRQIAASIKTFGFNIPLVIDGNDQILAGHGRLLACQQLGWTDVPTICISHLTPAQIRAFMIADNRLTENAAWSDELLGLQLKELSLQNLDFDVEVTGFDTAEIDLRIEGLESSNGTETEADAANALPALSKSAVTQFGDKWNLGRHRIVCGNALDAAAYEHLLDGKLAGIVFADAPYNVPVDGHAGGKGAIKHREFAMACGEMTEAEFTQFLTTSFGLMARFSKPGAIHFLTMDFRHMTEMLAAGKSVYSELKALCVWVKGNAGMGSLYRSEHELVFVFKNGCAPHVNNIQLGRYGRHRSNVWRYAGANSFARTNEEGNLLELHPTVKPVAMIADALLDCSARNDIVLDAFLGSGSTLMAAERTGRICYGIELDPLYVDTVIRRWQVYHGQNAVHAVTGQTFDEREAHAIAIAETLNPSSHHDSKGARHGA